MSFEDFRKDSQDFNKSGDTENNGIISQAKKSAEKKYGKNKIERFSSRKSLIEKEIIKKFSQSCNLTKFIDDLVLCAKDDGFLTWSLDDPILVSSVIEYNRDCYSPNGFTIYPQISISETIVNHLKTEGAKEINGSLTTYWFCRRGHTSYHKQSVRCNTRHGNPGWESRCGENNYEISEPITKKELLRHSNLVSKILKERPLKFNFHIHI